MEKFFCTLQKLCLSQVVLPIVLTAGALFDFQPLRRSYSFKTSELMCQKQGYDGLAVISSPEAYAFTFQMRNRQCNQHHQQPNAAVSTIFPAEKFRSNTKEAIFFFNFTYGNRAVSKANS
ncbi:hypothetical protein RRG08_017381 [Elysia crispata]|uniref:Uncharacterized protein n=1 Tax=Elysia crispata TaxID=231223 RepID=A0AAE1EB35_9GAST|nr:hypothetical protein RRG08_017381 [Elysia crispata]